jgi:hypothetical protein
MFSIREYPSYEIALLQAVRSFTSGVAKASRTALAFTGGGYFDYRVSVQQLQAEGLKLQAIANELNTQGIPTKRGDNWQQ